MHLRRWIINCYSDFSTQFDLYASFSVALFDIVYFLVFVFVSNFLFSERTVLLFVIHMLVGSIILQIRHYLSRELGKRLCGIRKKA